jgi:hypothetical protein
MTEWCIWTKLPNGRVHCKQCDPKAENTQQTETRRNCGIQTEPSETIIGRYLDARAKWKAAGKPTRSDEEVQRIYAEICQPCPEFNRFGSCRICGCRLSKRPKALLNKIAWATESCPIEKW